MHETVAPDTALRDAWRAGYEAGLRDGYRRVFQSPLLEGIAFELVLLRDVAERLGAKCDYWRRRADEMELQAERWHGVVVACGERGLRS